MHAHKLMLTSQSPSLQAMFQVSYPQLSSLCQKQSLDKSMHVSDFLCSQECESEVAKRLSNARACPGSLDIFYVCKLQGMSPNILVPLPFAADAHQVCVLIISFMIIMTANALYGWQLSIVLTFCS